MITAVAFVPQAPALVPEIGRGLAAELGPLRDTCRIAIRALGTAEVALVGDDPFGVGDYLVRDALGAGPMPGSPALVVLGDGSACLSEKAPGYLDPEAADRDDLVRRALRSGDATFLHPFGYDDERLLVGGSKVWDSIAWSLEPFTWDAELLYDDAPFGVGYFVAVWRRA